jgi:hypothetical protein
LSSTFLQNHNNTSILASRNLSSGTGHSFDKKRYEPIYPPCRSSGGLRSFSDKAAKGIVSIYNPGSENPLRTPVPSLEDGPAFLRLFQRARLFCQPLPYQQ